MREKPKFSFCRSDKTSGIYIVTAQLNLDSSWEWQSNQSDHHPPPSQTFKALPDKPGGWFSVCNLILTQLERRPQKTKRMKMTSKIEWKQNKKMEDDLKKNEWKTTSIKTSTRYY